MRSVRVKDDCSARTCGDHHETVVVFDNSKLDLRIAHHGCTLYTPIRISGSRSNAPQY